MSLKDQNITTILLVFSTARVLLLPSWETALVVFVIASLATTQNFIERKKNSELEKMQAQINLMKDKVDALSFSKMLK